MTDHVGPEDVQVQFTVKELLSRIDGKLDVFSNLLHQKAEKSDLDSVQARVAQLEKTAVNKSEADLIKDRLVKTETELEKKTTVDEAKDIWKKSDLKMKWVIAGVVVSIVGVAGSLIFDFVMLLRK